MAEDNVADHNIVDQEQDNDEEEDEDEDEGSDEESQEEETYEERMERYAEEAQLDAIVAFNHALNLCGITNVHHG
jgi:hypothetical protein